VVKNRLAAAAVGAMAGLEKKLSSWETCVFSVMYHRLVLTVYHLHEPHTLPQYGKASKQKTKMQVK